METKLANGVARSLTKFEVIHNELEQYVRADLRRRFDDEVDDFEVLKIIDEARFKFEFTDLANQMIRDFCDDDNCRYLWKMHEDALRNEDNDARAVESYRDYF